MFIALVGKDAQAESLFRRHVGPVHAELRHVELQIQEAGQQAARRGMRSSVIQIVQWAPGAAVYARTPMPAVGARRNAGSVFHLVNTAARATRYIVGFGAAVWAVAATITEIRGAHGTVNQKPERDRTRPFARR